VAFDVVIAGGGFGGLYGWTVGLLFGRASGEGDAGSKGPGA